MATHFLSYEEMKNLLGQPDRREESSNRSDLEIVRSVLRRAIRRELTPRQLECVQFYFYQKMTQEQIAQALGISKPTVCRHLQKAKLRLKRALSYATATRRNGPDDE